MKDITYENNYEIYQNISCDPTTWKVRVFKTIDEYSDDVDNFDDCCNPPIKYEYEINFSYVERYWGYCECEPGDEDYREDHQCCGRICDWDAPVVSISRCYKYDSGEWEGDEHDYWDFEDSFYKDSVEEKARKEEEERKLRIKQLEEQIADCKHELDKIMVDN